MKNSQLNQNRHSKLPRIILFVLISLVALSNAIKELAQAHAFVADVAHVIAAWSDDVVPTVSARTTVKRVTIKKVLDGPVAVSLAQSSDFRWNGIVSPGQTIEIRGVNGEIKAEPATANEAQVLATKTARRSDVNSVQVKAVQHAGGVTICALYPSTDGGYANDCTESRNQSDSGINNNDVRVDFTVRVPAGVAFVGRTVNGDISAMSLSGNVNTKTVNGSIRISTTGYAQAATVNGEISARLGDANWPSAVNFKTLNGEINLDLPANVSTDVDAETMNGQINSDFPINLTSIKSRTKVRGTIGSGGRTLNLKTLNGSINLRLAS